MEEPIRLSGENSLGKGPRKKIAGRWHQPETYVRRERKQKTYSSYAFNEMPEPPSISKGWTMSTRNQQRIKQDERKKRHSIEKPVRKERPEDLDMIGKIQVMRDIAKASRERLQSISLEDEPETEPSQKEEINVLENEDPNPEAAIEYEKENVISFDSGHDDTKNAMDVERIELKDNEEQVIDNCMTETIGSETNKFEDYNAMENTDTDIVNKVTNSDKMLEVKEENNQDEHAIDSELLHQTDALVKDDHETMSTKFDINDTQNARNETVTESIDSKVAHDDGEKGLEKEELEGQENKVKLIVDKIEANIADNSQESKEDPMIFNNNEDREDECHKNLNTNTEEEIVERKVEDDVKEDDKNDEAIEKMQANVVTHE